MKKHLLVLGMASMLALTSCHGTKKVDFKTFSEKATEAAKAEIKVKSFKIKGKLNDKKVKAFTVDPAKAEDLASLNEDQIEAMAYTVLLASPMMIVAEFALIPEEALEEALKSYTFYVGSGFKVKIDDSESKTKMTLEWNKKGLLVKAKGSIDGKKTSMRVSWKLEK